MRAGESANNQGACAAVRYVRRTATGWAESGRDTRPDCAPPRQAVTSTVFLACGTLTMTAGTPVPGPQPQPPGPGVELPSCD